MSSKITNREAISQVKGLFKEVNADSRLTNKQAYSLIKKHAFWIIKRESERLRLLRMDSLFQTKHCIDIVEAPLHDNCCNLRGILNCTIYRTKNKIPEMFEDTFGPIVKLMSSADGFTEIKLTTPKGIKRQEKSIYNKYKTDEEILSYFSDGYFYFPDKKLDIVKIEGLFIEELDKEDTDCAPCKDCKNECLKFLDKKFMVSDYLWAQIIDAVKGDLGIRAQIPEKAHTIDKNDNK